MPILSDIPAPVLSSIRARIAPVLARSGYDAACSLLVALACEEGADTTTVLACSLLHRTLRDEQARIARDAA